jgi:hypothetical protein
MLNKVIKLFNKLFLRFNYEILKKGSYIPFYNIDNLIKLIINYNPIIFDIGANKGQSIEIFKNYIPIQKFIVLNQ